MTLYLVRFAYLSDRTLGWLYYNKKNSRFAVLERPWIPNELGPGGKPRESCVPDGLYELRAYSSQRFPNAYTLFNDALGVWLHLEDRPKTASWGRSEILIHSANTVDQIVGCIAVGLRHGVFDGKGTGVLESRRAMNKLRAALGEGPHWISIRPTQGTKEKPL